MESIIKPNMLGTNWTFGGFARFDYIFVYIVSLFKKYEIPCLIKSVYGAPHCSWQGGRLIYEKADLEALKNFIDWYNSNGISVRLTFSNHMIQKEDLSEELPNKLLEYANKNPINGVILSSDLLLEYIKDTYPNLITVASDIKNAIETTGKGDLKYYQDLMKRYDIVVIGPYFDEKDLDKLDRNKSEFLADRDCIKDCPFFDKHYISINKSNYFKEKGLPFEEYFEESQGYSLACRKILFNDPWRILTFDIDKYINMGFRNFKVNTRQGNPDTVFLALRNFIKAAPFRSLMGNFHHEKNKLMGWDQQ